MMNTKKYVFLFKIVLFLVNYHECYFVFVEFKYYMKLFSGTDKILDFRGGLQFTVGPSM